MNSSLWSAAGLATDFVGVLLLGVDLVRLQVRLRANAKNSRAVLEELASEYGGTESWAADIKAGARWISEDAYSDYHAEDEVSYNARNAVEQLRDAADCMNGLAAHVSKITTFLDAETTDSEKTANTSFWYSIAGLALVVIGFGLQLVGAWPS